MKQTYLLIITFISINVISAQSFDYQTDFKKLVEQSKDTASQNNYEKLKIEYIKNGEDFTKEKVLALMAGQTASKNYDAYGHINNERSYQNAVNFPADTTYKYAKYYMGVNPISLSFNYGLWKTYEKDNDKNNAEKFKQRFNLLVGSILSTGDGSIKRPYFVISPIDGQVIIRLYYGKEIGMMGSGEDANGNFVDILEMVDGKNSKSLNFVIDHAMGLFRKQLKEVDENKVEDKFEIDENGKVILK